RPRFDGRDARGDARRGIRAVRHAAAATRDDAAADGGVGMRRSAVTVALAVFAASLIAQAPPAFDVASVKRTTGAPGVPPVVFIQADRLRAPFSTVRELVQAAYGVEQNQVVGGPEWAGSDHFDVNATLPPNTTVADSQRMLQRLLADRF